MTKERFWLKITFLEILHSPGFYTNLASLQRLEKVGLFLNPPQKGFLRQGYQSAKTYFNEPIIISSEVSKIWSKDKASGEMWPRRYAHMDYEAVRHLMRKGRFLIHKYLPRCHLKGFIST